MEAFARRYHACNPTLFQHEDTAFVLAFSVLMLHTDLHNHSNPSKMTKEQFVKNNRGIDDGNDIPRSILEGIYDRIHDKEFQVCVDSSLTIEELMKRVSNAPASSVIITPGRKYMGEMQVAELFKTGQPRFKKAVSLLIFNDHVIVAQKNHGRRYIYRKDFSLFNTRITALDDKVPHAYDLIDKNDKSHVLLRIQFPKGTEERCEQGLDLLRKNIRFCQEVEAGKQQAKDLLASKASIFGSLGTTSDV